MAARERITELEQQLATMTTERDEARSMEREYEDEICEISVIVGAAEGIPIVECVQAAFDRREALLTRCLDMLQEGYGAFSFRGPLKEILTIRQEGTTFSAVKHIGSMWVPKGAETIKGELDKDGFKTVFHYIKAKEWCTGEFIWEPCKWEITENGNKVVLDCGKRIRATLTRR